MSDVPPPRLPETFEGLRVGALRRSAGALAVHAATDRLDLPVELHAVRVEALAPATPQAFVAQLRRAADVRHDALLTYVTGGVSGDVVFAVARTVDAPGLDEVIARGGALAEERALAIGTAACGALAALERAGLRHGDLTLRRILLPGRGQVLVGPPRLVPTHAAPRNERYQSPEEARGEDGDLRSDLFALGLILAEAIRGEPVLKGPVAQCVGSLREGRVPADGGATAAGPRMRSLLLRLLAADPARRFPNAAAAERAFRGGEAEPVNAPVAIPVAEPERHIVTARPVGRGAVEAAPETAPIHLGAPAAAARSPADERPETAPIGEISIASVLAAANAAETRIPVTRTPGRLYVTGRLGETMLEIAESVFVGQPEGHIDLVARPDGFPEADLHVERRADGDVLTAARGALRVNGAATQSRALANGDTFEAGAVRGRYEREARTALRAAPAGPPQGLAKARATLAAAAALALVGGALAWSRTTGPREAKDAAFIARDEAKRQRDAARASGPGAGTVASRPPDPAEDAARRAYEGVREWARANPADTKGLGQRMHEVAESHKGTGHGAIAAADAVDAERRTRAGGGAEFETVLAAATQDAANGRLSKALALLGSYADERPGTVAAEQARTAAVRLEGEVLARLEGDLAVAANLYATGDPDAALRRIARIMDYVPVSQRDRVIALRRDIEKNITPPANPAGGPQSPPPGPKPPPGPGPGPKPPGSSGPPPGPSGGPSDPEDKEKAADTAFRAARKLMDSGKDEEAIDALLGFLKDHKDTKVGARYENEARGRVQSLAQGPAGVVRLFKGKVEKLEKGKVRISYDFEETAQFDDFRDVEAFEAPPRAKWSVADGAVRAGRGSGALVLDARFLVEDLDVRMRVSPDRPHDLGAAILDASEPRRFYLFTLQNSFFTLGKGPAAKVFEENAIVLFGPGMWRDTPAGQLGFVRKTGSPEPAVRPAEWTELRAGKHGANVTMKVGPAKAMTGSAYGDVKLEFQGMEPGVFVLGSAGVFDDFVVEGTPDPEWVSARWRAILSGL